MKDDKVGGTVKSGESGIPNWERDRPGLVLLTSHWLSRLGMVLAITATCTWLFFLPTEIQGHSRIRTRASSSISSCPSLALSGSS